MAKAPDASAGEPRRGRGQSAGLDRARIVEAARGLSPKQLTMQAVADRLGVDRSALHYHVPDRPALLELVAEDTFATYLSPVGIADDIDWREGLRLLARATRDSVVATGQFASYLRLVSPAGGDVLKPTEIVLGRMVDAGFDLVESARAIYALSGLAMSLAQGQIAAHEDGPHPAVRETRRALAETDPALHPLLSQVSESPNDVFDDASFDDLVDIFIGGLAQRLAQRRT